MKRKLKKYADERLEALNNPEILEGLLAYREKTDEGEGKRKKKIRISFISLASVCAAAVVIILCVCLLKPPINENPNNQVFNQNNVSTESVGALKEINKNMNNLQFDVDEINTPFTVNRNIDDDGSICYYALKFSETDSLTWEFYVVTDKNYNYQFTSVPLDREENIGAFKIKYTEIVESNSTKNYCLAEIITDDERIYITGKGAPEGGYIDKIKKIVTTRL